MDNRRKVYEYIRQILAVFAIACLVMAVLSPIYVTARRQAEETSRKDFQNALTMGHQRVTETLDTLQTVLYNLRHNTHVEEISLKTDAQMQSGKYTELYHVKSVMKDFMLYDLLNQTFVIQFRRNHVLIVNNLTYADKREVYGQLFEIDGLSYDAWQTWTFGGSTRFGATRPILLYQNEWKTCVLMNVSYSLSLSTSVIITVMLPVDALLEELVPEGIRDASLLCITDAEGRLLYATPGAEVLCDAPADSLYYQDAKPYFLMRRSGGIGGLNVSVAIPRHILYEQAIPVTHTIALMISIALLAALLYSAVYAYLYFRPMLPLIAYLEEIGPETQRGKSRTQFFRHAIAAMNADRERLMSSYRRSAELMDGYSFQCALDGMAFAPEQLEALRRKPVLQAEYVLLVIDCGAGGDMLRKGVFTSARLLLEALVCDHEIHMAERLSAAVPAAFAMDGEALHQFYAALSHQSGAKVLVAASGSHHDVEALSTAKEEAELALFRAQMRREDGVCRYAPDMRQETSARIPLQHYLNLTEALLDGSRENVEKLLTFFREKIALGSLSPKKVELVLSNLEEALEAAALRAGLSPRPADDSAANTTGRMDALEQSAEDLCAQIAQSRGVTPVTQIDRILAHIQAHYANPEFSLTMLGDAFALSEKYLSTYIKRETGMNYSAHIDRFRLEEARRLLEAGKLSIDEIASQVGYEHKNTFYKAFRRYHGRTPNSVREHRAFD